MQSKTYSEQFKRDAVALYENSLGTAIQTIATDIRINRATLHNWLKKYGTGVRSKATTKAPTSMSVTEAERIRQLERQVKRLQEERDILAESCEIFSRQETNW